ncbi:MAG TPA: flagellar hook-length control protein FliK [Frateuria sp.]|uniref:flagellar hook-length control protein FliK n=1 Tax=Frateuria sp. TaxID=2211372 RepID=UPI002DE5E07C|nr:flagellar hook-length control protein FliK [Frateuria sp.]
MSATTAAVNPVATPPPARPAADQATSAGDRRFDRHLDAARQQQGDSSDAPAHDDDHEAQSKPASEAPVANKPQAEESSKEPVNPDAAALAAAMLALIGQAAPAKPLAQATAATHVQAKAVTGAQAGATPAALVLLAGAAAAATAAKPAVGVDTGALAPMLAKPAEQKDAPLDAARLAGLANAPLATPDNAPVAAAPAHRLDIASPVGTPAFNEELGQQIAWLGSQDVKQARIRLHPEDLGALDVKVSINQDRVDVSFAVQHPAAVHALQQTLPQLDTLLAHHGLTLGQADVGQRQQQGEGARGGEAGSARSDTDLEPAAVASAPVAALGMLDTFA